MLQKIMLACLCLLLALPLSAAYQAPEHSAADPGLAAVGGTVGTSYVLDDAAVLSPQDAIAMGGGGIPSWTYEMYTMAYVRFPLFRRADPVNVIFSLPYSTVRYRLIRAGWRETSRWNILEANINFLPYGGFMRPQAANFFLDSYNGTRYHLRVWCMGTAVVGQAHIDSGVPHRAYGYESAEARVARAFYLYAAERNSCCLYNACYDDKGYYCNGWATIIKYK